MKVLIIMAMLLAGRAYHPTTITELTAENPANWKHPLTHIEVSGFVTYTLVEGDGDWHIRVCDSAKLKAMDAKHCIVAEITPEYQKKLSKPHVGQQIIVRGIGRYDGENPGHHFWEVHPVEEMETK